MKLNLELIHSLKATGKYFNNPYQMEVKCCKLEENELSSLFNLQVTVSNPKPVETGLFESNYILYEVCVPSLGWSVNRRFSDFTLLRDSLVKIFPQIFIPPLPKKRMGFRRFDVDFIEKRMKSLEVFINQAIKEKSIRSCNLMLVFLKENDREKFEEKFKAYHFEKFNSVFHIKNTEGKFYINNEFLCSAHINKTNNNSINVNNENNNENNQANSLGDNDNSDIYEEFENQNNYLITQNKLLKKLGGDLNKYDEYMQKCITKMQEIEKDFEMLSLVNKAIGTPTNDEIGTSFDELSCFFKNWNRILFNQTISVKNNLKQLFKDTRRQAETFKEFYENIEALEKTYEDKSTKLLKKKEKLYTVNEPNDFIWEITENLTEEDKELLGRDKAFTFKKMCTEETEEVESLNIIVQYLNQRYQEEVNNFISRFSLEIVNKVINFCEEIFPSLNDNISIWSTLRSFSKIQI